MMILLRGGVSFISDRNITESVFYFALRTGGLLLQRAHSVISLPLELTNEWNSTQPPTAASHGDGAQDGMHVCRSCSSRAQNEKRDVKFAHTDFETKQNASPRYYWPRPLPPSPRPRHPFLRLRRPRVPEWIDRHSAQRPCPASQRHLDYRQGRRIPMLSQCRSPHRDPRVNHHAVHSQRFET